MKVNILIEKVGKDFELQFLKEDRRMFNKYKKFNIELVKIKIKLMIFSVGKDLEKKRCFYILLVGSIFGG